ncbi:MAG: hypothetical protein RR461_05630 [Angelakisella sp.]
MTFKSSRHSFKEDLKLINNSLIRNKEVWCADGRSAEKYQGVTDL